MFTLVSGIHPSTKCFLLFTIAVYNNADAFGQIKISGKVVNSTGHPMGYASVELFKDSTAVQAVLTDSAGIYQMSVRSGRYYQNCRYAGSLQKGQAVDIAGDTVINIVFVKQVTLEEVVVSSKKPLIERKIDRYIFHVENSIIAIGSDALDALSKTPGIRVQNNGISLVGKSGVSVMIDDRLLQLSIGNLVNFLKSIPSDNIARIEVITNPPSNYDAQGNSGLINIVMKKNKIKGYFGSARLGYTQASFPINSGGVNFNYNSEKISLYCNSSLINGSIGPIQRNTVFYPDQTWEQTISQKSKSNTVNYMTGIDFKVSKRANIGLAYTGAFSNSGSSDKIVTNLFNLAGKIDSILFTSSINKNPSLSGNLNLHSELLLDKLNKKLVLDGSWFNYQESNNRDFINEHLDGSEGIIQGTHSENISISHQNIDIYTFKADITLPFKGFTLLTGGKLNFTFNDSDVSLFNLHNNERLLDVGKSNQFNYQEYIQASYISINTKFQDWDFQLGLRGEKTQAKGLSKQANQTQEYNYYQLFPTLFVSYEANKSNTFSVNYGRRINRPGYWLLNPFRWYLNPYSYVEGNPFLQPSYNNNIEFSHTYKGILATSVSFSREKNGFDQVSLTDKSSDVKISIPFNFYTTHAYQLTNSLSHSPLKWWETSFESQLSYSFSSSGLQAATWQEINAWSEYASINNQITFNKEKTLMGSLNLWYQAPGVSGLDKMRSAWNMDIGFKVLWFDKRLQLSIACSDIFRSNSNRFYSYINGIHQYYNNYLDNRRVRIVINFKIGNSKFSRKERATGNEEEKSRVK